MEVKRFNSKTQREILERFIQVRQLMDFFDDGIHRLEYLWLVRISNALFYGLNDEVQRLIQEEMDEQEFLDIFSKNILSP